MFSGELFFKSLFLLRETFSFARKQQVHMKTYDFDFLCSRICSCGHVAKELSDEMDNMFYEHFGMSGDDIYALMRLLGVKSL